MKHFSYIEKQIIYRLFGISDGFIFKYLSDKGEYNKTNTKEIILDSCGINIYEDQDYKALSQQKCIEKIINEKDAITIANLLQGFCNYFSFYMGTSYWSEEDSYDYRQVETIIKRLQKNETIALPESVSSETIERIVEDIEKNMASGTPELVLDRLHTFATEFLRSICKQHDIAVSDEKENNYPLHSLIGNLKKWYKDNNYFDSEFCVFAIQNNINIFEKFNDIRNEQSAAHPNNILNKIEAEYAVKTIAQTLMFIDKIEKCKKEEATKDSIPWDNGTLYLNCDGDDLPF